MQLTVHTVTMERHARQLQDRVRNIEIRRRTVRDMGDVITKTKWNLHVARQSDGM